jgi:hypothetical protein
MLITKRTHCNPSVDTAPLPSPFQVKLIDFGAACDLSTGINFNPEFGMLDPRYAGGRRRHLTVSVCTLYCFLACPAPCCPAGCWAPGYKRGAEA